MSANPQKIGPPRSNIQLLRAPKPEARHAARFNGFQDWVLTEASQILPIQRLLIASMIAFDGPWTVVQLMQVLREAAVWREVDGSVSASWVQPDGIVQRRLLSHWSIVCWKGLVRTAYDWSDELISLGKTYGMRSNMRSFCDDLIGDLLQRGRLWASMVLPPLLSEHLDGVVVLSAVSDATWSRQAEPVKADLSTSDEIRMPLDPLEILHQASLDGREHSSQWLLDSLKAAFSDCVGSGVNLSNDGARRRLIQNLSQLNSGLPGAGIPGVLLFGWVHDLLAKGSARSRSPAIQTLANYVHVAGGSLLAAMNDAGNVMDMDAEAWQRIYDKAQLGCTSSQLKILHPALVSFHRYLVQVLDIEPLYVGVFADDNVHSAASILWPRDCEALHLILVSTPMEARIKAQVLVLLMLLMNTSLRRSEISTLRVGNLRFIRDKALVDVAPRRSHKSLKSPAARRFVIVESEQAVQIFREWIERRYAESGVDDDLLFEDPHQPGNLFEMGRCYSIMMAMLKRASCDSSIGWHTCRHSFASRRFEQALFDGQVRSVSPLHKLQRAMGHAHLVTTIKTYCHLYERPLRHHLDQAIAAGVTSRQLEAWTGEQAATIRKRKSRSGLAGASHLDMVFGLQKRGSDAAAKIPDDIRSAPNILLSPTVMTLTRLLNVLSDIQSDRGVVGVCFANSISDKELGRVCKCILAVVQSSPEDLSLQVRTCATLLKKYSFARLRRPRWQRVMENLERFSDNEGQRVQAAWTRHGGSDGLSVSIPDEIGSILDLLCHSGFLPSQIRLRISREVSRGSSPLKVLEQEQYVELAVADSFRGAVPVEHLKPRRGRPYAYVVPLTRPTELVPAPPATIDSKSLHAVMYCHHVFRVLRDQS